MGFARGKIAVIILILAAALALAIWSVKRNVSHGRPAITEDDLRKIPTH